jgi:hypothetical protein
MPWSPQIAMKAVKKLIIHRVMITIHEILLGSPKNLDVKKRNRNLNESNGKDACDNERVVVLEND